MARESFVSTQVAMEHLGVSRATLNRWITDRDLPVYGRGTGRHLRFLLSELNAWMAAGPNQQEVSTSIEEITG
jgi:excisionase family DNA binding protein